MPYVNVFVEMYEIIDSDPKGALEYLKSAYSEFFTEDLNMDDYVSTLSEGQKAHLFNKLLKESYFSPMHTSIPKLARAIEQCSEAQGCSLEGTLNV